MVAISERIKEGLRLRNMKQSDLVKLTGIGKSSISTYISGEYEPKQRNIYKIAKALNVSEAWLMGADVPIMSNISDSDIIPSTGMVPIYGRIAAGLPILAVENIEGYQPVAVRNAEQHFCLRVKGDSMVNAGIVDGCLVLVRKQPTAKNGQIVACRVNGDEATLKRFKQQKDTVVLFPENSAYEPQIVPYTAFESGEAEIIGIVVQIIIDVV